MPTPLPTEEEIAAWDMEAFLQYGREGLRCFSDDCDELFQRRNLLITSRFGDQSPLLREVVMLSLAAEDIDTVREVNGWLEDAGDPAMGYFVYLTMAERGEAYRAEEFLISAARQGHFPAQRLLSDRKAREHGIFAPFHLLVSRFAHTWRVYRVARKNPKDLRLK